MENADGSIGWGIGYTDKKPRTLLMKICKELETKQPAALEGNGANGLVYGFSKSFITAFNSWKGVKKAKRLEEHLKYYCIEQDLKDKNGIYKIAENLIKEAQSGQHGGIERKTYADIGRRK